MRFEALRRMMRVWIDRGVVCLNLSVFFAVVVHRKPAAITLPSRFCGDAVTKPVY